MWVRFTCPACEQTHQLDMPETTIHMTCGQTGETVEMRLTAGGDVKSKTVRSGNEDGEQPEKRARMRGRCRGAAFASHEDPRGLKPAAPRQSNPPGVPQCGFMSSFSDLALGAFVLHTDI